MARFLVRAVVRNNNVNAADAPSAIAQQTTALQVALPGWEVRQVEAVEPDLVVGDWVVARRPDGTEAYGSIILNAQNNMRILFGDATQRGINAFVRRAP